MEELENQYGDAIDIVEKDLLKKLKPDQIYELYGLHKVYIYLDPIEKKDLARLLVKVK